MRKLTLTLVMALAPCAVNAQEITGVEYNNYCTLGPVRTCASANVLLTRFEDTSFSLEIRWRNMQGSVWGHDRTGGAAFEGMFVSVPTGYSAGGRSSSDFAGGYVAWTPEGSLHEIQTGLGFFDQVGFSVYPGRITHLYAGALVPAIQGCDVTMPGGDFARFLTIYSMCSRDDFDGWLVYRIHGNYSDVFTARDVELRWGLGEPTEGMAVRNGGSGSWCNPTDPTLCTHVVPEPGTWILLASGLVGLALFHAQRARGAPYTE